MLAFFIAPHPTSEFEGKETLPLRWIRTLIN